MTSKIIICFSFFLTIFTEAQLIAKDTCRESNQETDISCTQTSTERSIAVVGSDLDVSKTFQSLAQYTQQDPVLQDIQGDLVKIQGFEAHFSVNYKTKGGSTANLCPKVGASVTAKITELKLAIASSSSAEEELEPKESEEASCSLSERLALCSILKDQQDKIQVVIKQKGNELTLNSLKDLMVPYYKQLTRENAETVQILKACKAKVTFEIDGPELSYQRDFSK